MNLDYKSLFIFILFKKQGISGITIDNSNLNYIDQICEICRTFLSDLTLFEHTGSII